MDDATEIWMIQNDTCENPCCQKEECVNFRFLCQNSGFAVGVRTEHAVRGKGTPKASLAASWPRTSRVPVTGPTNGTLRLRMVQGVVGVWCGVCSFGRLHPRNSRLARSLQAWVKTARSEETATAKLPLVTKPPPQCQAPGRDFETLRGVLCLGVSNFLGQ